MRIGVLRGHEDSFPYAFVARVNSTGQGVYADFVQLGGTSLNQPVPFSVIVDRVSHLVPYCTAYLKMAALQGVHCINHIIRRSAHDRFFAHAAAERLGVAQPRTVLLPNRAYGAEVGNEDLRNLWPVDFGRYLDHVGVPCLLMPVSDWSGKEVVAIHSEDELLDHYNRSGERTLMLQERVEAEARVRVLTVGRREARAMRHDLETAAYAQDAGALPAELRDAAEEAALSIVTVLGYDMGAVDFAVKGGRLLGGCVDLVPELDYQSLKDAHFPWVVEKMAAFAVQQALAERSPQTPVAAEEPNPRPARP